MATLLARRQILAAGAGLAAGSTIAASGEQQRYGIHGRRAPELLVKHWIDHNGDETQLDSASLAGKWVFIKMWQSWCPGCHKYGFPTTQKLHAAFGQNPGLVILGIQTVFEGFGINTESKLR